MVEPDDRDPWRHLFRPGAASRWFVAAQRPAFDPCDPLPALTTAWWFAELSRLVYRDDPRAEILAAVGLDEVGFVRAEGTQCMVVTTRQPRVAVCVFRGTDEARDWWTNLQCVPADWLTGGKVHRGHAAALDAAWPAVGALLDALALPVVFAGHSLGGALAQLAASRRGAVACHAFGAPRVGDAGFCATLMGVPVHRFVVGRDLVPALPLDTPLLQFAVAGTECRLPTNDERPVWSDPPAPLADHTAWGYVEALRRAAGIA